MKYIRTKTQLLNWNKILKDVLLSLYIKRIQKVSYGFKKCQKYS